MERRLFFLKGEIITFVLKIYLGLILFCFESLYKIKYVYKLWIFFFTSSNFLTLYFQSIGESYQEVYKAKQTYGIEILHVDLK